MSATFDPTSHTIVSGSADGTVRFYPCDLCGDLDELLAVAKRRLATAQH